MKKEIAGDYYVWQPPDKNFSIHLDYSVIDKMNVEVMRGFGAVRRRGAEVGGILLGKIEPAEDHVTVTVDAFETISCEYAFGPSYVLSQPDLQRFRKALAEHDPSMNREIYTVGYYRSHTREGLGLDDQDIRFFREYFPDPLHVFLLVKPYATRAGQAGFFIQENGVFRTEESYLEFPFRRRDLGGGASANERPDRGERRDGPKGGTEPSAPAETSREAAPPELVPPVRDHVPPATTLPVLPLMDEPKPQRPVASSAPIFAQFEEQPASPWRKRIAWLAFGLALIGFGLVVGNQYGPTPLITPSTSSPADAYSLNLSASRVDDNVMVKWDKGSQAVKNATRGLLTITEGPDSKAVQMDPAQLQNGSVLYRHVAPEINFKLEVFIKDQRSVVETLKWEMKKEDRP